MKRRALLLAIPSLLGARIAWTQPRSARLGVLSSARRTDVRERLYGILLDALREAGWTEGRNLTIDWRFTDGELDLHDAMARELVALKPDAIFAPTQPAAVAVQRATDTIPIVFALVPEPVQTGLAVSLARPGKNATGAATMNAELVGKRLELMRQALPGVNRLAIVYQPEFDHNARQFADAARVAPGMGFDPLRVPIGGLDTFDAAFAQLARLKPDAVYFIENPVTYTHRQTVTRRMNALKLVAMYGLQDYVIAGGLMSYSVSWQEQYRRAAGYVVQILRGAKPGELPVSLPTHFELTVNLGTARAVGVTIPPHVLLRADRVIE